MVLLHSDSDSDSGLLTESDSGSDSWLVAMTEGDSDSESIGYLSETNSTGRKTLVTRNAKLSFR